MTTLHETSVSYALNRWNTALRRALKEIEGRHGRVLEAGCGSGRFIRAILRERPDLRGCAFDIEPGRVSSAKKTDDGIEYALASLTNMPYADESFDIVFVFDVLEHLGRPELGVAELHRVLKPGGLLHALVPCEGEPFTLHWLLARLDIASHLKEQQAGHVSRFSQSDLWRLLSDHDFKHLRTSYSMHPMGQVKDVMTYLAREDWARRWRLGSGLFKGLAALLWGGSYMESWALSRVSFSAVAVHVSAEKKIR
jgi:ubiquinone/menaquinone biosynthesis C-methylase UbiE